MALGAVVGSIRSVAMAAMPRLVKIGFGSNAIINWLKPKGLSYRRQTMLRDIRTFTGLERMEKAVRLVDPAKLFPQGSMVESSFRAARRYKIHGTIAYIDPETGETVEDHISFYSNQQMTKDQWLKDWFDKAAWTDSKEMAAMHSVTITSVEHQAGWGI